jgi:repressor LexA
LENILGERIRQLRQNKGLTQQKLAEMLNTTNATISNYETGASTPDYETLQKIADIFNVTTDYLLGRTDEITVKENKTTHSIDKEKLKDALEDILNDIIPVKNIVKVPILGTIRAGDPIYAEENIEGYTIVDEEDVKGSKCFFLRVKGDSMINARIMDGDLVFVREQPDVENGEIAVVIVNGDEATIKRVYKLPDAIILQPENSKYKPIVIPKKDVERGEVRIIGKVIFTKVYNK